MNILRKFFNPALKSKATPAWVWIADLANMDDISAIEFTTKNLGADFKNHVFQDVLNIQTLFSIDEKTHSIVERITVHFIRTENMNSVLKARISNAVFLYHQQLLLIYFELSQNNAQLHQSALHVFLARAMRNATQMIKWRHYNYHTAPAYIWSQISTLYKIAEQNSLLNAKVQSYPNQQPISLSSAYIHACMLGSLESISFKPQQIELISKLLIHWSSKLQIDSTYDAEQHLFYIDTAGNSPAKRIRNFKPADTYRYWGFDDVNSNIELCMLLIEYNITPRQMQMRELISNKYALDILETLSSEWSRLDYKRQRRVTLRLKSDTSVNIAYGFSDICNQFGKQQNGTRTYENIRNVVYLKPNTIPAKIVDQSDNGLGLDIIKQAHELALDMLVGISNQHQKLYMQLGQIRSVKSLGNGQLRIGVELISGFGIGIILVNTNPATHSPNSRAGAGTKDAFQSFIAIYTPQEQCSCGYETLIIPKQQYNTTDILRGNLLGQDVLIKLSKVIAADTDWIQVKFNIVVN